MKKTLTLILLTVAVGTTRQPPVKPVPTSAATKIEVAKDAPTIPLEIQLDYANAQSDFAQAQAMAVQAKSRADQLEQQITKICTPWVPARDQQTKRLTCVEAPKPQSQAQPDPPKK